MKFGDGYSSRFEDQIQRTTIASRCEIGRIGEYDVDSESDGNLPLVVAIIKKHSSVPPRHNLLSFEKRMHTEMVRGDLVLISNVEKIGCSADGSCKQKRPMQLFTISPPKIEAHAKTPFDARGSMRKMRTIQPTLRETKKSKFYFVDDDKS